jgi:hypothetical protein
MEVELEDDFYFDYDALEISNYQDPNELLAALKQKEKDVILAAQLGNTLLLENRQLKDQSDKLHEQYADKLEVRENSQKKPIVLYDYDEVCECVICALVPIFI